MRRSHEIVPKNATPQQARDAVARRFRQLATHSGINLAQFRAQLHEEEMVEMIVGFTQDVTQPAAFRRQCALDVLTLARGAVKPWIHTGETINPNQQLDANTTVGDGIKVAREMAAARIELNDLVAQGIHPSQWPEHVRLAAGEALEYFATLDAEAT